MSRSLLKDVDIDVLYGMRRNESMSNREIAESLGVSCQTIYRLIGPQPKGIRSGRSRICAETHAEASVTGASPCLAVRNKICELDGVFGHYVIDTKNGEIDLTNSVGQCIRVSKDNLGQFIDELMAIKRKLEVVKFENEMW